MSLELRIEEEKLPVFSAVATKALDLLKDDNATNQQIQDVIRKDPALTERVLGIANSPFYSRVEAVSISSAVTRLGIRQLRKVILTAATGQLFDSDDAYVKELWRHGLMTAMTANILAESLHPDLAESAYVAGLLHDVGKLVIYSQHQDPYREAIDEAKQKGVRLHQVESEKFKFFDHMSVGGLAARKWGLDDSIAEAARFHHAIEHELPSVVGDSKLVSLASLASILANNMGYGQPFCEFDALLDFFCVEHLSLTEDRLDRLAEKVQDKLKDQEEAGV